MTISVAQIDAWTDGIVKVLERLERLRAIDDGIAIIRRLRDGMRSTNVSGYALLERAQVWMEKRAVEICREATSSVSGMVGGLEADSNGFNRSEVSLELATDARKSLDPLTDSSSGSALRNGAQGAHGLSGGDAVQLGVSAPSGCALPDSLTPSVEKGTLL